MGGNQEHMRYTGYTPEQWRQIEYNNQMIQQQHIMQQQMMQQHMMQAPQHAGEEESFPTPPPLLRQTACTPVSSAEMPPSPPPLVRRNAQPYPEPLDQETKASQREQQLREEVEILRQQLVEKIEREKKQALAEVAKSKTPKKMSWAEMCESDYEDEEESDLPYDSDSDSEFAKIAPATDDEEDKKEEKEQEEWTTVSHKKKNKKKQVSQKTTNMAQLLRAV